MTAAITSLATPFPASPLRLAGRPALYCRVLLPASCAPGGSSWKARSAGPAAEDLASTAWPALDRLLCGGLRRGALVELVGPTSSGRFSLVLGALAAATRRAEPAALVDLGDGLEPRLAEAAGIELDRLLWVRPRHCAKPCCHRNHPRRRAAAGGARPRPAADPRRQGRRGLLAAPGTHRPEPPGGPASGEPLPGRAALPPPRWSRPANGGFCGAARARRRGCWPACVAGSG